MGTGGISIGSLILIFLIVALLFGTKRLRNIGEDLGHAVRNFRRGLNGEENSDSSQENSQKSSNDRRH